MGSQPSAGTYANLSLFSMICKRRGLCFLASYITSSQSQHHTTSSSCAAVAADKNDGIMPTRNSDIESRLRAALWSFFAGDALSAPTHWFYGGFRQVQQHYGRAGIADYTKPVTHLPGSIMNKSDLNGGGRARGGGGGNEATTTIIGDVICHGKADLWSPHQSIHYHATLQAGEETLEASLGRVLLRSMTSTGGRFDASHFRQAYVSFMMQPNSHQDAYASTCHRMFFANLVHRQLPAAQCPDNDQHNVDTMDGLVLPTVVALGVAARLDGTADEAGRMAAQCVAVTRRSAALEQAATGWGKLVFAAVREPQRPLAELIHDVVVHQSKIFGSRRHVQPRESMTACYLNDAFPALLEFALAHENDQTVWPALLANANGGGENVHRGSCLGALLATRQSRLEPARLVDGLYHRDAIPREIDAFVQSLR